VSECDREASIMRRPWFTRGCCAMGGRREFYACSVVGIVPRLRTGQTGVRILEGVREFSVFFKPSGPAQDPSSLTFNTYRYLFREYSGRGATLTPHLHLASRFRRSGATPLLPHYVPSRQGEGQSQLFVIVLFSGHLSRSLFSDFISIYRGADKSLAPTYFPMYLTVRIFRLMVVLLYI
jgi:hypothetical protein